MIIENKEILSYSEKVIVISSEGSSYPNSENDSTWFTSYFYGYYENGIELWVNAPFEDYAIIYAGGRWILSENKNDAINAANASNSFRVQKIARIPYSNIVRIEEKPDEWNTETRIYCKFNIDGKPCEGIYVEPYISGEKHFRFLDNNKRISKNDLNK